MKIKHTTMLYGLMFLMAFGSWYNKSTTNKIIEEQQLMILALNKAVSRTVESDILISQYIIEKEIEEQQMREFVFNELFKKKSKDIQF